MVHKRTIFIAQSVCNIETAITNISRLNVPTHFGVAIDAALHGQSNYGNKGTRFYGYPDDLEAALPPRAARVQAGRPASC